MLASLALIFLCGMFLGNMFKRIGLPSLLGMLLTGIILGPYALNVLDEHLLIISSNLRELALIIILTRAGLSLDINDLKKVGRPAILMCFFPACFEMVAIMILAPIFLHISLVEAVIMGAVVAAVSPAVVVPKMLHLMEEGYGTNKAIPQMIMAGASVDDVFVIVIFTSALGILQGDSITSLNLLQIPISILSGIIVGIGLGIMISFFFKNVQMQNTSRIIVLLSLSFLLLALENIIMIPFSGLLAVMSMGVAIQKKDVAIAKGLSKQYSTLWIASEIILFVLVGASVDINYAFSAGFATIIVILGALLFRILGVFVCLIKTNLKLQEKLFCMIAYMPKATVQAAIGSIPLSLGLACGNIVLSVAVLAILISAPLGAIGIEMTYKKLLTKNERK